MVYIEAENFYFGFRVCLEIRRYDENKEHDNIIHYGTMKGLLYKCQTHNFPPANKFLEAFYMQNYDDKLDCITKITIKYDACIIEPTSDVFYNLEQLLDFNIE